MEYLTPALLEASRQAHRALLRLKRWRLRRQLAQAETALGLLGWQQADFDGETLREVQAIHDVEREQTRLINLAAELGNTIRAQRSELEARQREHTERQRLLTHDLQKLKEPRTLVERTLAERRKLEPVFQSRIPELDRELREVSKLLADLLRLEKHNPKIRQEMIRLRERTVAIPNEKNDLRTQHFRIVGEIRSLEASVEKSTAEINAQERQIAELASQWSAEERERSTRLREMEKEKARAEKAIAELEAAKSNPYQQIGRVLAQANVAPMNQPHALEEVKKLELALGALAQELLESTQLSALENRRLLHLSYLCWTGLLVFFGGLILWTM